MNALLPQSPLVATPSSALRRLETYVEELHQGHQPIESLVSLRFDSATSLLGCDVLTLR